MTGAYDTDKEKYQPYLCENLANIFSIKFQQL